MTSRVPPVVSAIAIGLLCVAVYGPPSALTPFFTKGEPREGLVVRQMIEGGDWVLPKRLDAGGWTIASKPPMFHWLAAAVSSAAGKTTPWSVRAPSVLLCTLAVLLVWLIGRTILAPDAALAGAVVLATTFEWVRAASTARVDGVLAAFTTAGLLIFYRGVVRGGLTRSEALVAYACLVGAALTKGPVGFVLPLLVVAVALAVTGRLRTLKRFHPLMGAVVIVGAVGGWYLLAAALGGEAFVQKHILKENLFRFIGATKLRSGHAHPFHYYFPTFAAGFLPWTPLFLGALIGASRSAPARRDPAVGFLLVWVAVVFLFYSAASAKRSVYLLALYPGAALLTGWWWHEIATGARTARWLRSWPAQAAVVTLCVAAALPFLLTLAEGAGLRPLDAIAPFLHHRDQANLPLVRAAVDAHLPLALAGLMSILAALLAIWHGIRNARWTLLLRAHVLVACALWILVFGVFQPELAGRRSLGPFMERVERTTSGAPLAFHPSTFDFGAAFYARAGIRRWQPDAGGNGTPEYVLIWDVDLSKLGDNARDRFETIATSDGTDPNGRKHLVLTRVR